MKKVLPPPRLSAGFGESVFKWASARSKGQRFSLKTEKAMKLQDKVNKIKEVESKLQSYQTESEEEETDEKFEVKENQIFGIE